VYCWYTTSELLQTYSIHQHDFSSLHINHVVSRTDSIHGLPVKMECSDDTQHHHSIPQCLYLVPGVFNFTSSAV